MPGSAMQQNRTAVRQILRHARDLLASSESVEDPPLTQLLARAVDLLSAEEHEHLDPPALAQAVGEASSQLLARCRTPIGPSDPHMLYCLQALDRLPRTARIGLLTAAIRYTTPDPHGAQPSPVTGAQTAGGRAAARGRRTGPCPCPCNSGGFCGGCGHAGCGGRR